MASNTDTTVDPRPATDFSASIAISRTLFAGLLLSIAIMVLGLLLVAGEGAKAATHVVPLNRVIPHLVHGSRPAVLDSGILVLFGTPLLGVVVAFVQFVRQRDAAFSVIAALLLMVLAAGFLVALH